MQRVLKQFEPLWIFDPTVLFSARKWKQFWPFCNKLTDSEVLNNASRLVLYASCITAIIQQDLTPLVIGPLVLLVALFVYISARPKRQAYPGLQSKQVSPPKKMLDPETDIATDDATELRTNVEEYPISMPSESNTYEFAPPAMTVPNPNLDPSMAAYYVDLTANTAQVPSRIYKAPKWVDGRAAHAFLDNSLADGGAAGVHGNHGGQVGATPGAVGGGGLGAAALNASDFRAYNSRTMFDYPSMYGCDNLDNIACECDN
jgi:hypothetical protein